MPAIRLRRLNPWTGRVNLTHPPPPPVSLNWVFVFALFSSSQRTNALARVKSGGSLGRADSYAFLEVFFDAGSGGRKSSSEDVTFSAKAEVGDAGQQVQVGLSLDRDENGTDNRDVKGAKQASGDDPSEVRRPRARAEVSNRSSEAS